MHLGIDVGTSGVKAVVIDADDQPVAEAIAPLTVSRPRPLWSEQDPEDWWRATVSCLESLAASTPAAMSAVGAVGLSGQMHGVTLLDGAGVPVRPAVLWNDGRAGAECAALQERFPDFADIVGCRAMANFSAPKLLWLSRHEPDTLTRARHVLLPKDYVRLRLTGELASDRADSSATLLMDTPAGDYHDGIVAACGIDRARLPRLVESSEISGGVRPEYAARWRLAAGTPVVGGGGDTMCAGVGVGAVTPGAAYVGIGTSAVYILANDSFVPATGGGLHTHRHAVNGLYAQHAVILSGGGALAWVAGLLGERDVGRLVARVEQAALAPSDTPVFTPYLAGERAPHDDPTLSAAFSGLTYTTGPLHLAQAVMEGVALALADGHEALADSAPIAQVTLTGGGGRSRLWARLIAAAIGQPVALQPEAQSGPAVGAARLARLGVGGPLLADRRDHVEVVEVDARLREELLAKQVLFRRHLRLSR